MADTISIPLPREPEPVTARRKRMAFLSWHRLALAGIMLIAVFMDFFQLGQNGFATYYPPAVRSMMDNWHNFFFASYDPGAFVTIDKPPVGFWLQVFSAKIFGFNTFSVLVPQALSGVVSVLLLYYLVRRHFGVVAGLLAALALALFPISVVTNRTITIDSTLAMVVLAGAWAVMRAAETGHLRWLLLSAAIVGIGFNIKMMEAYLVVPAYGALYLLASPRKIWTRIGHLALAALVLVVVSFSWVVAVDLTPASQRPYVDSTQDNSEVSLAIGYNGIDRLIRNFGGGRGGGRPQNAPPAGTANGGGTGQNNTPAGPMNAGGTGGATGTNRGGSTAAQQPPQGGFGGLFDTGAPGPFRLFNEPLGGQIAWLLPLALLGMLALAWQRRPRFQSDHEQQSLILWGTWLLTTTVFFSIAGFFHQYYMTQMAPAVAALFGIGIVVMWRQYREGGWRGWLLPLAIVLTIVEQVHLLSTYPTWAQWIDPLIIVLGAVAVAWLLLARLLRSERIRALTVRTLVPALGVGVLALLFAPSLWAVLPVIQNGHSLADSPLAGPAQNNEFGGGGGRDGGQSADPALIRYLEDNQGGAKFLVAVPSSMSADSIILATNKPVMAMGGFSGSDPILTTNQLSALISNGTVRFFLLGGARGQIPQQILKRIPQQFRNRAGGFAFGGARQSALTTWVTQHCTKVPAQAWQTSSSSSASGSGAGSALANQLYDCAAAHQ